MFLLISTCGLLIAYYYRVGLVVNPASICVGKLSGCEDLANLPAASAILGIPNSFWGIIYFSLLIVYAIYKTFVKTTAGLVYSLFLLLCISASLFSLYLVGYQIKIGQYCPLCLITSFCVWITSYFVITDKLIPEFKDTVSYAAFVISVLLINIAGMIAIEGFYNGKEKTYIQPPPSSDVQDLKIEEIVNLENHPYLGDKNAKLILMEFGDPTCPICKTLHQQVLKPLINEYKNRVKYYYMYAYGHCKNGEDFFAVLDVCKNLNKFFECVDILYENQDSYYSFDKNTAICSIDYTKLKRILNNINITEEDFSTFYNNTDKKIIVDDVRVAMDLLKIEGTPTLFFLVDGKMYNVVGLRPLGYLKSLIERFLK